MVTKTKAKTFKAPVIDWKARQRFPKNNFFKYRWRVIDNFNRSIEREQFHNALQGGNLHHSLVNERVLALYKMGYRRTKNDFMSQLTESAMTFLDTRKKAMSKAVQEDNTFTTSMTEMVDMIFNILLSCSIELNTVLGFSELFIAATEPEAVTFTSGSGTKFRSLRARLSTSHFALVVHGQKNQIAFYIMPVEDLIGLSQTNNGREPEKMLVASIDEDGDVFWSEDDTPLGEDELENVCMRMLRELIQTTQDSIAHCAPV